MPPCFTPTSRSLYFPLVVQLLGPPTDISLSDSPDTLLDCRAKSLPFHHHTTSGLLHLRWKASQLQSPFLIANHSLPFVRGRNLAQDRYFRRQTATTNTKSGFALVKSYQIESCHLIRSSDNIFNEVIQKEETNHILDLKVSRALRVGL